MIRLHEVAVAFDGLRVLDRVSAVLDADVVGVIGPNGAGKSTLFDAIGGLVPVAPGSTIELDGVSLAGWPAHRRARQGLGRSFQSPRVADERSVADNIAVVLDHRPLGRGARADALAQALRLAGLEAERDRPCGVLDGFARRRVEIARAIAGRPRAVLLDEPAAGATPAERAWLAGLIARIGPETGAQVVVIDHDVPLVARVCRQTLVLALGRVVALGPTAQVLADPRVRAVYLGDAPAAPHGGGPV